MRALDLFAGGCGGWSLGLHRAGIPTVAACEIDPWRRAVYGRNNPGVRLYEDVRDLTADRLVRDLGFLPDVVVGSPPCQDASSANHRGRGVDGERTGLFFEAIRLVGECRPVWACLENVPGIRTRGIDRVLAALEALDYAVWPLLVGAVHAGAPHRRNRVWFVAADADIVGWRGLDATAWNGSEPAGDASDLPAMQRPALARREPDGTDARGWRHAADTDQARLEILGGQPRDNGQERAAAERDGASPWVRWNGGFAARAGRVDDGLPRGVARPALAAYGDAVVPQIAEAIARTMLRLLPARAA